MPYADLNDQREIESRRKRSRKYYASHRDKEITRCAKWNKENSKKVNAGAVNRRSKKLTVEQVLYNNAKNRAKTNGVEFNISKEDILVPRHCPILGIELVVATVSAKPNSPSIDRINPELGYIRGNIQIISHKANTMKSDAKFEDIEKLYFFMKKGHGCFQEE